MKLSSLPKFAVPEVVVAPPPIGLYCWMLPDAIAAKGENSPAFRKQDYLHKCVSFVKDGWKSSCLLTYRLNTVFNKFIYTDIAIPAIVIELFQ